MSQKPRMRLTMTPVSPVDGRPRTDAPTIVYTVPRHRAWRLWQRLCRINGGRWPVVTPDGFSRYAATWMTEDYYQSHRPAGPILHRSRAERIVEGGPSTPLSMPE